MLYPYLLFLHLIFVMMLFGVSMSTDAALSRSRRVPAEAAALMALVRGRLLMMEGIAGAGALLLGIALLFMNPAGMAIMKTGGWMHMKVTFGLLAIVLILASRAGFRTDTAAGTAAGTAAATVAKWVQPVRGTGQLLLVLAVFAVKVYRML